MTGTVTHSDGILGSDTALLSACGTYRYELTRGPLNRPAVFVMLNPSTADAAIDDPTIRRCRGFARAWGCGGLVVVNAFALRATNPAALRTHPDPVGPYNDTVLATLGIREHGPVVVAWGVHATLHDRDKRVLALLRGAGVEPMCLGVTKDGHPRHPLYVRGATTPVPYGDAS
jgi:hypothetical protein